MAFLLPPDPAPAGDFRALIVSDVAARGLDIPEVDAVFHLELPTGSGFGVWSLR